MDTLRELYHFLHDNPQYALGAFWIFNVAVQALPRPMENSGKFYTWIFNVCHTIAGNIGLLGKRGT